MKIRRFVAKDMRTALLQIKEELGVEAVIMSNKKIPEGIELMAAVDHNQAAQQADPSTETKLAASSARIEPSFHQVSTSNREVDADKVTLGKTAANQGQTDNHSAEQAVPDSLSALLNRKVQQQAPPQNTDVINDIDSEDIEQQFKSFTDRLQNTPIGKQTTQVESESPLNDFVERTQKKFDESQRAAAEEAEQEAIKQRAATQMQLSPDDMLSMQQEMASIRQLLEHQVSGLMWQDMAQKDPSRALLVNRLIAIGLTEQVADQIAGYVPAQCNEEEAWEKALTLISKQINTTNNDIIHRGGVVALVGPTGVGKTTTIAKLAARFAQLYGADQVAMVSTDNYRIAGFEQLVTYGRIIGCQVKLAQDDEALDLLLQQFSKKKLVLIDTAGMGQRDLRLAEHLTTLISNARVKIRNYLVLSANTQQRVMQENVERFKKVPLSGCIYTKLDESVSVGEIISTSIQNGLPIGYLTDGQRVPEDIKVANAEKLVTLANKMSSKLPVNNSTVNNQFSALSMAM